MILEARNITAHFAGAQAIRNVSLLAVEGEITGIIGANGAGKTTVLRAISGLKDISSGEILFQGERIDKLSPRNRTARGISLVPEGRRLFPYMSVMENLHMGAYSRKDTQGIEEDLEAVFGYFPVLKERRRQRAGSLSGGEQQMLSIGRSLMAKPKLILLDEPSQGLSPKVVSELADLIKRLNKKGLSVVLVEQNSSLAFKLSHMIYVLRVGQVVLQGKPADLGTSDYVKKAYLGG